VKTRRQVSARGVLDRTRPHRPDLHLTQRQALHDNDRGVHLLAEVVRLEAERPPLEQHNAQLLAQFKHGEASAPEPAAPVGV
jgi:hypothetical protein